jgi:hypothetical protein
MTKMLKMLLIGAAVVAAPSAIAGRRDTPEQQLQKLIGDRVPGKPVDCIPLYNTQSSTIIDHRAIVYRVGSRLYVNTPRSGADSLDDDTILVTKTIGSQLCSIDTVHLIDRTSRFPRGFVQLGAFVPYNRPGKR